LVNLGIIKLVINLKRFTILNPLQKEIDFIEGFYKRRIQDEIETYQGAEDKN